jgi:tetratricopeptide (TPR) repeat protein
MSRALALVLALCLAAAPARAEVTDELVNKVEQLYAEGAALYRAGRFADALARFHQAYRLYPEPNLLYNAARCQEAAGEIDAAIAGYRRFLAQESGDAAARDKASARLLMLEHARARSRAAVSRRAAPSPAAAAAPPRRSSALTVSKWLLLGTSVAAAASGTAVFVLGARDHARLDEAITDADGGIASMTRAEAVELRDSGNSKKWAGYALWGVAGAALISSIVLFAKDRPAERRVDVALAPSAEGGALLLRGRF